MCTNGRVVTPRAVFKLTKVQRAFWALDDLFQNLEGAVRSGKTTVALLKLIHYCEKYPGLAALICRWKEKDAFGQLAPKLKELAGTRVSWSGQERCFEFRNGSRVYVRGLKPSEGNAPYSQFSGLTVALGYVDQVEELPEHTFDALKARFSQPNMPHFCMVTPNPIDDDHWLARQFPASNANTGYRYLKTSVYDNRAALGDSYIAQLELSYPIGHPLRRRYVDGERGVSVIGTAVYKGYFNRSDHVAPVAYDPALPLYEGWDFGHHHPAVTWVQFQQGGAVLAILGGVQGESLFLETFAPHVLAIRDEWFPAARPPSICSSAERLFVPGAVARPQTFLDAIGDPSGGYHNSQGTDRSAVTVLAELGIDVRSLSDSNHPERRNFAIQQIAGYMQRKLSNGSSCFVVNPQFKMVSPDRGVYDKPVIVDGFELGYVWDELSIARTASPNTRRPKKNFPGDVYSHNQNGVEYIVLAASPSAPGQLVGKYLTDEARAVAARRMLAEDRRRLREYQRDHDPADHALRVRTVKGVRASARRGGY